MLLGIDVSWWQGEMDWYKSVSGGAKFAYIRAGSCQAVDGVCYTDFQFERNAGIAVNYLPIGFYWYFRPNWSPVQQAQYFVDLIGYRKWCLPPVIDVECSGDCSPAQVKDAIKLFLYQIYHFLDVDCVLYTRAEWWNRCVSPDDLWRDLPLWVARYTTQPLPWGNEGDDPDVTPRDWQVWTLWQHSADNNGRGKEFGAQSASIDLDWYFGTEKQFEYWAGHKVPAMVKVKSPAAALCAAPAGATVGTTWRGRCFEALDYSDDGEWIKVCAWLKKSALS